MAGIAGHRSKGAVDGGLDGMLEILNHRGPDARWSSRVEDGALGVCTAELGPEKEFTEVIRTTTAGYRLNSPKELYYYRLFRHHFPEACFEPLVGRWDPYK